MGCVPFGDKRMEKDVHWRRSILLYSKECRLRRLRWCYTFVQNYEDPEARGSHEVSTLPL